MTPLQVRFFRASTRAEQKRKLARGVSVAALVALSGATSLLAIRAQRTEQESSATQLATKSEWIGNQSPALYTTSALLAVKASETFENASSVPLEVDQALRSGLKVLPTFRQQLKHKDAVTAVSFSNDSTLIVTASEDNTARIWNAQSGEAVATLNHKLAVNAVSFSNDDNTIATASADNTARIWYRSWPKLAEETCNRVSRNLTAFEWDTYIKTDLKHYELICPTRPAHPSLLRVAKQYAQSKSRSDRQKAIAIFRRAQTLDPDIDLDPSTPNEEQDPNALTRSLFQTYRVEEAQKLAKQGSVKEAIEIYEEAQKSIEITAVQWNNLCRYGSLNHHAPNVMFACDSAVELEPNNVEIKELKAGHDPFTDEVLENLLSER